MEMHGVKPPQRRPIGVSTGERGIVVVCDDGSVWIPKGSGNLGGARLEWDEVTPIPGSARAGSSPLTAVKQTQPTDISGAPPSVVIR